ncbi:hypothetical protein BJ944DRAFT_228628 [Cunninghamella echinulata]|nr:hypothetical protein BJ944DRAFT_228628 [Cunninghamella echinulata]
MATTDSSQPITPFTSESPSYENQFINLLKEITKLQWVRESLPVQTKYYEGLKLRLKRELHLKTLIEKQLQEYRQKHDANSNLKILKRHSKSSSPSSSSNNNNDVKSEPSYTDLIERLRHSEAKITDIETQIHSAESMLQDLRMNKHSLDTHCMDLHSLYDEIIPDIHDDPAHIIEKHLKEEVIQLASDIPRIENDIQSHTEAQSKLYEARECMEKAMMSLPGASTFLDRQALASRSVGHHSLFGKSSALSALVDITIPSLKDAENLASKAYELQLQASKICREIPVIPTSAISKDESVMNVLTAYRGYRLKIESILRTQLNPRLIKLQSQLAMTRYHYEQKTIEWIDQQITMLENLLRENGCLQNINLDREISILRMGSNAAIVAVSAETSNGRITVDDALEVASHITRTHLERNGHLPEYSENARSSNAPRSSYEDITLQQRQQTPFFFTPPSSSLEQATTSSSAHSNNDIIPRQIPSSSSSSSSPLSSLDIQPTISTTSATSSQHLPAYSRQTLAHQQEEEEEEEEEKEEEGEIVNHNSINGSNSNGSSDGDGGDSGSSSHNNNNNNNNNNPSQNEYLGPEAPPAYFR